MNFDGCDCVDWRLLMRIEVTGTACQSFEDVVFIINQHD